MSFVLVIKLILLIAPFFVDFNACTFKGTSGCAFANADIELVAISFFEDAIMVEVLLKFADIPRSPLFYYG